MSISQLTETPWFCVLITFLIWLCAIKIYKWKTFPLTNPVFLSVSSIILSLMISDVEYEKYNVRGKYISFLLGPSVVALAIPFYKQIRKIRETIISIGISALAGSVTGIISAMVFVYLLGGDRLLAFTMAPKSATTTNANEISGRIGGIPPITVGILILTGILGGMMGPELLRLIGVKSRFAMGLAVGLASHGIGTARVLENDHSFKDKNGGAMSGIGMTLNGILTSFFIPFLMRLFP